MSSNIVAYANYLVFYIIGLCLLLDKVYNSFKEV